MITQLSNILLSDYLASRSVQNFTRIGGLMADLSANDLEVVCSRPATTSFMIPQGEGSAKGPSRLCSTASGSTQPNVRESEYVL